MDLDSGGGVFLKYRGIWNLVGSLLYVQPYGDNFNGNYAAQLPAYYNWIEDVVLDSDGDGISDYNEENDYLTNINSADSDNDGISDGDEVYVYATDPNNSDSDADGLPDGFEISYGDGFSVDPEEDIDGDGATNYEEWIADTIPTNAFSRLHILNTLNPLLLEFTSSSNREYQIQYSTNLTRDFWITYNWIDTNVWITGEHPTTSVNIPTNTYNRINRVKARLP